MVQRAFWERGSKGPCPQSCNALRAQDCRATKSFCSMTSAPQGMPLPVGYLGWISRCALFCFCAFSFQVAVMTPVSTMSRGGPALEGQAFPVEDEVPVRRSLRSSKGSFHGSSPRAKGSRGVAIAESAEILGEPRTPGSGAGPRVAAAAQSGDEGAEEVAIAPRAQSGARRVRSAAKVVVEDE